MCYCLGRVGMIAQSCSEQILDDFFSSEECWLGHRMMKQLMRLSWKSLLVSLPSHSDSWRVTILILSAVAVNYTINNVMSFISFMSSWCPLMRHKWQSLENLKKHKIQFVPVNSNRPTDSQREWEHRGRRCSDYQLTLIRLDAARMLMRATDSLLRLGNR